jgi:hypothetical protein
MNVSFNNEEFLASYNVSLSASEFHLRSALKCDLEDDPGLNSTHSFQSAKEALSSLRKSRSRLSPENFGMIHTPSDEEDAASRLSFCRQKIETITDIARPFFKKDNSGINDIVAILSLITSVYNDIVSAIEAGHHPHAVLRQIDEKPMQSFFITEREYTARRADMELAEFVNATENAHHSFLKASAALGNFDLLGGREGMLAESTDLNIHKEFSRTLMEFHVISDLLRHGKMYNSSGKPEDAFKLLKKRLTEILSWLLDFYASPHIIRPLSGIHDMIPECSLGISREFNAFMRKLPENVIDKNSCLIDEKLIGETSHLFFQYRCFLITRALSKIQA